MSCALRDNLSESGGGLCSAMQGILQGECRGSTHCARCTAVQRSAWASTSAELRAGIPASRKGMILFAILDTATQSSLLYPWSSLHCRFALNYICFFLSLQLVSVFQVVTYGLDYISCQQTHIHVLGVLLKLPVAVAVESSSQPSCPELSF